MKTIYTAIGGRMTKWKGKVVSFAPYVSASIAMGIAATAIFFGTGAVAQVVSYSDGAAPIVLDAEKIDTNYQYGTGDIEALISGGSVTSSADGSAGAITARVLSNAITATGVGNTATASLDLSLVTGTATASNAVIASSLENFGNDAFAQISGSSITNSVTGGTTDASAAVSGNTIATSVTLAKSTNMLEGSISNTFANTDAGSVDVTATDYGLTAVDASAGLVLQSTQLNEDVQNATAGVSGTAFSYVTGSDVNLTVSGGSDTSLLSLDSNSISASFKGTSAANTVYVEDGGLATLSSTAGISNVQVSETVGTTLTAELKNAVIAADSGIAASVTDDLDTTSVELTQNSLATSAAQNTATNTLYVADGISVDASGNSGAVTSTNVALDSSAATASIDNADLFISNVQTSTDSSIISETNGLNGISLTSTGSAQTVAILATSNTISALTTGNKNTGNLIVAGANALEGVVAQTNVQSFLDATDFAAGTATVSNTASAAVINPTLSLTVASASGTSVDSSVAISLSSNAVTASATSNTATMTTSLKGNSLTDGVPAATAFSPSATTNNNGSATVTAGFSSVNSQTASGDGAATGTNYVADSQITDTNDTMGLTVGTTGAVGTTLQNAALAMSSNAVTSTAKANTGTQSLTVSANDLTASAAVVGQQALTGGVLSSVTGTSLALSAVADGAGSTDVANVTMTAASNAVTSSAVGNTAANALSVSATTLTAVDTYVGTSLTDARDGLTLDGQTSGTNTAKAAMSLLNNQYSTPTTAGTEGITSSIDDAGISVSLKPDQITTTGSSISNLTMSLDSNSIGSTARANLASNSMALDFGSLSLSTAARNTTGGSNTTGGTNIAILGSSQVNENAVTSTVDGTSTSNLLASVASGTGDIATSSISTSSNAITSLASGNGVTNTFALTGTSIETPDANALASVLTVDSTVANSTTLTAQNTAFAVGNDQTNTGDITSSIGDGAGSNLIGATADGTREITDSTIAVDDNRMVAQAVAASDATTTSTVDATSIATSFLSGSRQLNTGDVSATVGSVGGVTIEAMTGTAGTVDTSNLTASSNTVGATATATSDVMRLTLGGSTTATLDGSGRVGATSPSINTAAGTTTAIADYAQIESQTNTGSVTATTTDASILSQTGTTTDSTVASNSNLLTAMATGISGTSAVTGTAASIGGTTAPTFALASSQNSLTGFIAGTLSSALIAMDVTNTGAATNSENLSINSNTLSAAATAITASNTLTTTATGQMAGRMDVADLTAETNGAADTTVAADRALLSEQTNASDVTGAVGTDAGITLDVADATAGTMVSVASNTIAGSATGINGVNTINTTAGAALSASSGLAASQANSGTVAATVDPPTVSVTLGDTVASSAVDIASNAIAATGTGVAGTNRVYLDAGSIAATSAAAGFSGASVDSTGPQASDAFALVISRQSQTGAVSASVTDGASSVPATLALDISGATSASTLSMTSNSIAATAIAGTVSNVLSLVADTSIELDNSGAALLSFQSGTATTTSEIEAPAVTVALGAAVSNAAVDIASNAVAATATGLVGVNRVGVAAASITATNDTGDASATSSATGAAAVSTAANLQSYQNQSADVSATVTDNGGNVPATVALDITGATSASALSMTSNSFAATASLGSVTNVLSQVSDTFIDFTNTGGALLSVQNGSAATTSTIESVSIAMTGAAISDSTIAMTNNKATASATGFSATNANSMTAGTAITGDGVTTVGTLSAASLTATGLASVLGNTQVNAGAVTATFEPTSGTDQVAPQVSVVVAAVTDSAIDVSSNTMRAQATGLSADNRSTISGGTLDQFSALETNYQAQTGAVTANLASPQFSITTSGNVSGTTSTDGNIGVASATGTTATNRLSVTSDTSITGVATAPDTKTLAVSTGAIVGDDTTSLLNSQSGSANVMASINDDNSVGDVLIGTDITGTMDGSISANSNILVAQARGNVADSAYAMTAGTSISGATQGLLASSQNRSGGRLLSEIYTGNLGQIGVSVTDTVTGAVSVSGNTVRATGTANLALNSMSIAAGSGIDQLASSAGTAGSSTIESSAQYAVMNGQSNTSGAASSLTNFAIGVDAGGSSNSGSMALNGNMMMADTTGNNAVNSLMLASGAATTDASASVSNYQANSGAMSSTINDAAITMSTGSTSGSVSVANNAISASAVGNTATTTISTNGSAFKSF